MEVDTETKYCIVCGIMSQLVQGTRLNSEWDLHFGTFSYKETELNDTDEPFSENEIQIMSLTSGEYYKQKGISLNALDSTI
jgi:hypothetical protein